MAKDYVYVAPSRNAAEFAFKDFITKCCKKLTEVSKNKCEALDEFGNRYHFMSEIQYDDWCIGRTYVLGGKLYYSGYMISLDAEGFFV